MSTFSIIPQPTSTRKHAEFEDSLKRYRKMEALSLQIHLRLHYITTNNECLGISSGDFVPPHHHKAT